MQIDPSYGWLIAGALLLAIEAFGAPGIGFLFAGLAAIATGVAVHFGLIDNSDTLTQLGVFCVATAILAALLWKKLQSWRMSSKSGNYTGMIGDVALVGKGGLSASTRGQVSWSGTTMMAEVSPASAQTSFGEGEAVEIIEVKGNILIVASRK